MHSGRRYMVISAGARYSVLICSMRFRDGPSYSTGLWDVGGREVRVCGVLIIQLRGVPSDNPAAGVHPNTTSFDEHNCS